MKPMVFRTELQAKRLGVDLHHQSFPLLMGSCFAQQMAARMEDFLFQPILNPFGIVYNPISINHQLQCLLEGRSYEKKDLQKHQGQWFSYDHHSFFNAPTPEAVLTQINQRISTAREQLAKSELLFITLGTAKIYTLSSNGEIVSNCHKLPAAHFDHRLLKVEEIVTAFQATIQALKEFRPQLQLVFTISPVRHLKDGFHENQLSKATLLLAVEELCLQFEHCHYFPAYELLLDDLRDYRFFADDLLHPNEMAVQYIWQKLMNSCVSESTEQLMQRIQKIQQAANHKAFQPNSTAHQNFLKRLLIDIRQLQENFPDLPLQALEQQTQESIQS